MTLQSIQAVPHPDGHRIDLSWRMDASAPSEGVRIVRRQGRYPQHPEDGVLVADAEEQATVSDLNLPAERLYYYALFPFNGDPPVYVYDTANRTMAMATAPNGYADLMLRLLPAIYHRYDKNTQFLARFVQLIGGQLDQLHSFADFSARMWYLENTPGPLLPLLAQWIAWKTDYKRDLNGQRNEIKNAPAVYRRMGLLPTVEATIKRISNWESRSKEYVHNVFASNRPPRLNMWSLTRDAGGEWSTEENLQSLDYCYEGRAGFAVDINGIRRLFYHTQRKGRWEIWSKTTPWVALSFDLSSELAAGTISSALWQALSDAGLTLTQTAQLNNIDTSIWEIVDGPRRFVIEQLEAELIAYDPNSDEMAFGASRPLVVNDLINKYPTAAVQGETLWLFWTTHDETTGRWQVALRRHADARWSSIGPADTDDATVNPFIEAGIFDAARPRRRAFAAADDSRGVWLFWQEHDGAGWRLRYNRHDGAHWGEPITLPLDGGVDPRVRDDIMVVITPSAPDPRIYLFWARQSEVGSGAGRRWEVALRVKGNQTLDGSGWSGVHVLPKNVVDDHHDREPFALINSGGEVELFWSSNRGQSGWSIWRSTLLDHTTDSWGAAECITEPVYMQRAPMVVLLTGAIGLFYRSNRKMIYSSAAYRTTETHDERYAGSFIVDVRHQELIQLRDRFEDPQRYTYDTGSNGQRDDGDRIARDTIGEFVDTDSLSEEEIQNGIARLRRVIAEFLPMTDRAVFIPDRSVHTEHVYDYDLPLSAGACYILSSYADALTSTTEEIALGPEEDFNAILES